MSEFSEVTEKWRTKKWELDGRSIYVTSKKLAQTDALHQSVSSIDSDQCYCERCGSVGSVFKPVIDTNAGLESLGGICATCLVEICAKYGGSFRNDVAFTPQHPDLLVSYVPHESLMQDVFVWDGQEICINCEEKCHGVELGAYVKRDGDEDARVCLAHMNDSRQLVKEIVILDEEHGF